MNRESARRRIILIEIHAHLGADMVNRLDLDSVEHMARDIVRHLNRLDAELAGATEKSKLRGGAA